MKEASLIQKPKAEKSDWQPKGQTNQKSRNHSSCGGCSACNKITGSPTPSGSIMLKSLSPDKKVCATRNLQQTHGNLYIQRMISTAQSPCTSICGEGAIQRKESGCCGGCAHGNEEKPVMTKLKVNAPGDKYEQEADRVADRVMKMSEPHSTGNAAPDIQKKCDGCEEEIQRQPEEEDEIQRQEEEEEKEEPPQLKELPGNTQEATPDIQSKIHGLKGGGQPLPENTRAFFEPRFGHDFGGVRVHTDSSAGSVARSVNAKAFTHGSDVVFGQGEYSPGTLSGQKLLAHELTHVVQQGASSNDGLIRRTSYSGCTNAQRPSIRQAVSDANTNLAGAIAKLTSRPIPQSTQDAMWLVFRNSSEVIADRVAQDLSEVQAGLPSATMECEQVGEFMYDHFCGGNGQGYTRPIPAIFGIGNIHLCMQNWQFYPRRLKSIIVLHEGTHRYALKGDKFYFDNRCHETGDSLGKHQVHRLANADSYACIVHHLAYTSGPTLRNLANRAGAQGQHTGLPLQLSQQPGGTINLDSGNALSPQFEIGGAPVPDTYQYRWMIMDEQDRRYLMWGASGTRVSSFGSENAAYIPSRTRALLKSNNVSDGYVLCRVRIGADNTRLFRLPVNFTWTP